MDRRRIVGAAALLMLLGSTAGEGRELLKEDFRDLPSSATRGGQRGPDGRGWTQAAAAFVVEDPAFVDHTVSFGAAKRGLVSFDLQRRPGAPASRRTVFSLRDAAGQTLFLFQMGWSSAADARLPEVFLDGAAFVRDGMGLWSRWIPLDREVAPGQWIHLDLIWDDGARRYRLFVDGRPIDCTPRTFEGATGRVVPDPRAGANQDLVRNGLAPQYFDRPFGDLVSRARSLVLGVNLSPGRTGKGSSPLSNAVLDNFVVAVDEAFEDLRGDKHDVRGLQGAPTREGNLLTWSAPEIHGVDQRYLVYRRRGGDAAARFERLTAEPIRGLRFVDAQPKPGEVYRYSVASVYGDLAGGTLEGRYPPEVAVAAAPLAISSVSADRALYGAGQEIVVTARGTADARATFDLAGVTPSRVEMVEVDDGLYVGTVPVPAGAIVEVAALAATLSDPATGESVTAAGPPVGIDTVPPEPAGRVLASTAFGGAIEVAWEPSPSADLDHYDVYRGEGRLPSPAGAAWEAVKGPALTDVGVVAGLEYAYAVVAVDRAGNRAAAGEFAAARAEPGEGPRIGAVAAEPAGRPLRPGTEVLLTVTAQSGGAVTLDLGALSTGFGLQEEGRSGRYVGRYLVTDADVRPTRGAHRLVAHLTDPYGAASLAGPEVLIIGRDALDDVTPPRVAGITHDGWQVAGLSGVLVAGDRVTVRVEGEAGGYGSFDVVGVRRGIPLVETAPGEYGGTYCVTQGDQGMEAGVVAHLFDEAGNETVARAERGISVDTRIRLAVVASEALLPADRKSQARLTAKATDANGDPVEHHELALTLATTDEYTGVVGGGALEGRSARLEDEDDVEVRWGGETDRFGEVSATYTAGFAAKTALLVAKDLTTGDVGFGWLNTYVASTVALDLAPRARRGADDRAVLRLAAEPAKLTADGRSTSRLKAWLTDLAGAPLAGVKVAFALGGDNGRLRTLRGTTDARGQAEAEYRAGTLIGTVTVTASSAAWGVGASLPIALMSDAPARVDLVASATRLPADGESQATLFLRVSDVHDNPNAQVPVLLRVLSGSGDVGRSELLTDRNGEARAVFTAGTRPGTTIVEARHTSRPPTAEELGRVLGTVFVPRLYERQERDRLKVAEWLVEPGQEVAAGESLVVLEGSRGAYTLASRAAGRFVRPVRHPGDRVEIGETLGYVAPESR